MQRKLFQKFLSQEVGASGNNIETSKATPKIKNIYITYLQRIFASPEIQ